MLASNPNTWEAEAGGPGAQGRALLHNEFKTSLGYKRPCHERKEGPEEEREGKRKTKGETENKNF